MTILSRTPPISRQRFQNNSRCSQLFSVEINFCSLLLCASVGGVHCEASRANPVPISFCLWSSVDRIVWLLCSRQRLKLHFYRSLANSPSNEASNPRCSCMCQYLCISKASLADSLSGTPSIAAFCVYSLQAKNPIGNLSLLSVWQPTKFLQNSCMLDQIPYRRLL